MPDPVEQQLDAQTEQVLPGEETPAVETHDGFIALDKHQKDVNVQHKRFRDEERGRVKETERANVAEARIAELEGQNAEIVIPPVPDKYSETFDAEMKTRDGAITAQAAQTAAQTRQAEQLKEKDEARLVEDSAALNTRVATFDTNLVTHGLNSAEVKAAAETVIGFGISNMFQDILLDDKDGPLMVQYLSDKPLEAEQMNAMTTMDLVNHLNAEIRPKALLLKPQTSTAPEPPVRLDGGGAPETKESWEQGAKYE